MFKLSFKSLARILGRKRNIAKPVVEARLNDCQPVLPPGKPKPVVRVVNGDYYYSITGK